MMKALFGLSLLLGGCASVAGPGGAEGPVASPDAALCDAAKISPLIGRKISPEIEAEAKRLSGAQAVRVLRPGDAATMDYRHDRLNILLDAKDQVAEGSCN